MLFYRIEGTLENCESPEKIDKEKRAESFQVPISEFYAGTGRQCHISIVSENFSKKVGILCAVIRDKFFDIKIVEDFISAVDLNLTNYEVKEITMRAYTDLLRTSDRNDYIKDDSDVLSDLNIEDICGRRSNRFFDETITTCNYTKSEMHLKATELLFQSTFIPEIDRIYMGKSVKSAIGHPVHYFIQNDDKNNRDKILEILLTALYQNQRLQSRRYSKCTFPDEWNEPGETELKTLYKSCRGGTVVICFNDDNSEENELAKRSINTIMKLCNVMRKYRNDVLTIFCLPATSDKIKNTLYYPN